MTQHNSASLPATHAYRTLVATTAAHGGNLPHLSHIAFGSGSKPYSPESDTALEQEIIRVPATADALGPVLTARTTLSGSFLGDAVIREIGAFADDGTLIGRRTIKPTELEHFAELDIEMTFEY